MTHLSGRQPPGVDGHTGGASAGSRGRSCRQRSGRVRAGPSWCSWSFPFASGPAPAACATSVPVSRSRSRAVALDVWLLTVLSEQLRRPAVSPTLRSSQYRSTTAARARAVWTRSSAGACPRPSAGRRIGAARRGGLGRMPRIPHRAVIWACMTSSPCIRAAVPARLPAGYGTGSGACPAEASGR